MRLLKTDDFSSVFNLRLSVGNDYFQVLGRPNALPCARLGVVVGRRVDRRAVARNYIKRTVRELFRCHGAHLYGIDLVVRPRRSFGPRDGAAARAALLALFQRIRKRLPAEPGHV
ncbi:ribonuclease P protein component [Chitiniphilus purpureus]|uniref:Ribonuclease P protein component n=1 Tax=Chitiniphilus purpureus TaxID=2981137 RepID=A0ABY6DM50_9NEIS|nr:ribonuclease P protein component [Chitiniphilus sp. CD1]UXY15434.1 ribonuclease P protein component [Chitiniphilus sp. CD1]